MESTSMNQEDPRFGKLPISPESKIAHGEKYIVLQKSQAMQTSRGVLLAVRRKAWYSGILDDIQHQVEVP
jgi:hypothetical protein